MVLWFFIPVSLLFAGRLDLPTGLGEVVGKLAREILVATGLDQRESRVTW